MEDSNGSIELSRVAQKRLCPSELSCGKDSSNYAEIVQVSNSPLPECPRTETEIPKWTNEKHSLYIKSLETSFVNQLYDSMDMLGRQHRQQGHASEYKSSDQKHSYITTPSGQYKVFKDGSWTRINFWKERPQPRQPYEFGNILSNPWVKHYRLSVTNKDGVSLTGSQHKSSSSSSSHLQMDNLDNVERNEEATDQNFIDEDSEEDEEKQGRKRDINCEKISVADDFRDDQVVP